MERELEGTPVVPVVSGDVVEGNNADAPDSNGKGRGKPNESVNYDRLIARMEAAAQRKRMLEDAPGLRTPNSIAAAAGLAPSQVGDIYKRINQPSTQTINALAAWAEENPIPWLVDAGHVPAWVLEKPETHRYPPEKAQLWQLMDSLTPGQRAAMRVFLQSGEAQTDVSDLPPTAGGPAD